MKIVFENSDYVFVDKDSMVLTVPPRMKDKRPVLGLQLQEKYKTQIYPVHRLDYEVSGIVCFAKTERAHRISQSWFEDKIIVKYYEAKTDLQSFDHWPMNVENPREKIEVKLNQNFHWESKILRGKKRSYFSSAGDLAITDAKIEKVMDKNIIWLLNPVTGKPHQLRLELSYRGFPICGDVLYGSKAEHDKPGIALNSYKLDFTNIKKEQRFDLPDIIETKRKFV